MTTQETYDAINALWPRPIPACTRAEAERAARRLMAHFDRRGSYRPHAHFNRQWVAVGRRTQDLRRGWRRVVHDVSHIVFGRQNRQTRGGHGGWHAELELKMTEYVIAQGWLDGALRPPAPRVLTLTERRLKRYERAKANLAAWERRARLTATRVKKWKIAVRRAAAAADRMTETTL